MEAKRPTEFDSTTIDENELNEKQLDDVTGGRCIPPAPGYYMCSKCCKMTPEGQRAEHETTCK